RQVLSDTGRVGRNVGFVGAVSVAAAVIGWRSGTRILLAVYPGAVLRERIKGEPVPVERSFKLAVRPQCPGHSQRRAKGRERKQAVARRVEDEIRIGGQG